MRDAFGGIFMIRLFIVFIFIYVAFAALSLNYAKAFRVKNQVINILEQHQYTGTNDPHDKEIEEKIDEFLIKIKYYYGENESVEKYCEESAKDEGYIFTKQGACIIPIGKIDKAGKSSRYYKVMTYITIDFPFELLMNRLSLIIPVSGETKVIHTS